MDKSLLDLRKEVIAEQEVLYKKAFELFCKDELSMMLDTVREAEKRFNEVNLKKNSMSLESLKKKFTEEYDRGNMQSLENVYMEKVKNG